MNRAALSETLALAAATGMRSMSGPAALTARRGGTPARVAALMACGEMIVDKTSFVGDRTDPVPLAGRAAIGGMVRAVVARRHGEPPVPAAVLGALVAIGSAYLANYARRHAPGSPLLAGAAEDAVVVGLCASVR